MPTIRLYSPKKRDKTVNKQHQQSIYQDARWKRLREQKFRNNPLCEVCEEKGRVTPTQEIHHKTPWETGATPEEQEALAFDYENLLSCCTPCHKEEDRKAHKKMTF